MDFTPEVYAVQRPHALSSVVVGVPVQVIGHFGHQPFPEVVLVFVLLVLIRYLLLCFYAGLDHHFSLLEVLQDVLYGLLGLRFDGGDGGEEGRLSFIIFPIHALILLVKPLPCPPHPIYYLQQQTMIRLEQLVKLLPELSAKSVKGDGGVVGVVGGSFEYTGAPYYSAMAALKMGADLAHIFCSRDAAGPIKTYSPELIVHPIFDYNESQSNGLPEQKLDQMSEKWMKYFKTKFERISCWVIGPGLGRNQYMNNFFPKFISALPAKSTLVIDADGLYHLCKHPQLIQAIGKINCTLTPNHREFFHLNKILKIDQKQIEELISQSSQQENKQGVAFRAKFGKEVDCTVVIKGAKDVVLHRNQAMSVVGTRGGLKRCGGIGDVLAGCLACTSHWDYGKGPLLACHVVKVASLQAFAKHGRSLTGLGVLEEVGEVVKSLG